MSKTTEADITQLEKALSKEFPKSVVQWLAKTLTREGGKALALAYIDSRAVMNRLDQVVGANCWQDDYKEFPSGRMACGIGILFADGWVWKWDGAGETAIEADKGTFSGAFKRAAVKWGIGRYLYDMGATWVPCSTYTKEGKTHFKEFTADPWDYTHYRTDEKREKTQGKKEKTTLKDELLELLKCPALSKEVVNDLTASIKGKQVKTWYEKQIRIVKGLIADADRE